MMRSPRLRVVFAFSAACLAIFCVPDARGQQTYKQSTIGAELTAAEYQNFKQTGRLPPQFVYSSALNAIVKRGGGGGGGGGNRNAARDAAGDHEGQVLMPRWEAIIRRVTPSLGSLPSLDSLSGLQGMWPAALGGSSPSPESAADADESPGAADADESPAAASAESPARGGGFSPTAMLSNGMGTLSHYWNSVSGSGEKAAPAADGDEPAAPGLMASTYSKAKDVATSPLGQEAIKFALGFLPGGGSAVRAYETGTKLAKMSSKADDIGDKIPDLP